MKTLVTFILCILLFLNRAQLCGQYIWDWERPDFPANILFEGAAHSGRLIFGGEKGTVLSTSDGADWTVAHTPSTSSLNAFATDGKTFVGVGGGSYIFTSVDGENWSANASPADWLAGVTFGYGRFIAAGAHGADGILLSSLDGSLWFPVQIFENEAFNKIGFYEDRFLLASQSGGIWESLDGWSWTRLHDASSTVWKVCYGNGNYLALENGASSALLTSADGQNWSRRVMEAPMLWDVEFANGSFFYLAGYVNVPGAVKRSQDALQWEEISQEITWQFTNWPTCLVSWQDNIWLAGWSGALFASQNGRLSNINDTAGGALLFDAQAWRGSVYAVGSDGFLLRRDPAGHWTTPPSHSNKILLGIAASEDALVAVGDDGEILRSTNGLDWTLQELPEAVSVLYGLTYGNGQFFACGGEGKVFSSNDGQSWVLRSRPIDGSLAEIKFGNDCFVMLGRGTNTILRSTDGSSWESIPGPSGAMFYDLSFAEGWFYAFAESSSIAYRSQDGRSWESLSLPPDSGDFRCAVGGNGITLLAGSRGTVTLLEGNQLQPLPNRTSRMFLGGTFLPEEQRFFVVGEGGAVLSSPWSLPVLEAPAGLAASKGSTARGVELYWEAVPEADFYEILRSATPNPEGLNSVSLTADLQGTSFLDTSANPGQSFYYTVVAHTRQGQQSARSPVASGFRQQIVGGWHLRGVNPGSPTGEPLPDHGLADAAAGLGFVIALDDQGNLLFRGLNIYGLGDVPQSQGPYSAVAAGYEHALAVTTDGRIIAWGNQRDGRCAIPEGLSHPALLAAGGAHSIALSPDRQSLVAWGDNRYGQCSIPSGLGEITAIAAGGQHSLALLADGSVRAWGDNRFGQVTVPSDLPPVRAIAAGARHSLVLLADGSLRAWGDNSLNQCSLPPSVQKSTQRQSSRKPRVGYEQPIAISSLFMQSLVLDEQGQLVVWGGSTEPQSTSEQIPSRYVRKAVQGDNFSVVLTDQDPLEAFFADTRVVEDGWHVSDWFGWMQENNCWPWVYHGTHGWIFCASSTAETNWIYDRQFGWLLTGPRLHPLFYCHNTRNWLYHQPGSLAPNRWFYDYASRQWQKE